MENGVMIRQGEGAWFRRFYLDREKDIIVDLFRDNGKLYYVLSTPNHGTGNLIRNLARLCDLPLTRNEQGLFVIRGEVPSYVDGYNRLVYILRLGNTKVANIYPDGQIERKAGIPAISKTLMSQTKDYHLDIKKTIVKTYIRSEQKFRTDLHTHMNANLEPDVLIALGICHQIRYPLYYIRKLGLKCSPGQQQLLEKRRAAAEKQYENCGLTGKYLTRRIDDHTYINFADLILQNPEDAPYNIPRIRRSLSILKDGQAVFTNLEKVYLYRYVFTKGIADEQEIALTKEAVSGIPDEDIRETVCQIRKDRESSAFGNNTLFQDKLLWIARGYARQGICYAEISDTTLVKKDQADRMLRQVHEVMPAIREETGVLLRFLAAIRRIPLTIVKDQVEKGDYFRENLEVLRETASDPYVAGSDIIGEEMNDILDIRPVIREIVQIAEKDPSFVIRIHAGENDSLRDNVANSIRCVRDALRPGQPMPRIRIGHGLYTANLKSAKGQELIRLLQESQAVLEFQITSNVRLNNLSVMRNHPLRQYLSYHVNCVQGTDGGALYGTCSIDEQLSLEKMLELTDEEMLQMRRCEERVLQENLKFFEEKKAAWEAGWRPSYPLLGPDISLIGRRSVNAAVILSDRIDEMPTEKLPVVIAGGSFNHDKRSTKMSGDLKQMIDHLLDHADPEKVFFVIGHALRGYEGYLAEKNNGKFDLFAIVPSLLRPEEAGRLRAAGASIRVSIESVPMGIYKSFAYEIFKRRPSVLIALDGNSAGANLIQEAKNSRYPCRIFVNRRCRVLRTKAETLEGYVTLMEGLRKEAEVIEEYL